MLRNCFQEQIQKKVFLKRNCSREQKVTIRILVTLRFVAYLNGQVNFRLVICHILNKNLPSNCKKNVIIIGEKSFPSYIVSATSNLEKPVMNLVLNHGWQNKRKYSIYTYTQLISLPLQHSRNHIRTHRKKQNYHQRELGMKM